jgi:hypothetical protein
LWPVVPNGTFRELQFDDFVTGPDGEELPLKKGTFLQVGTAVCTSGCCCMYWWVVGNIVYTGGWWDMVWLCTLVEYGV